MQQATFRTKGCSRGNTEAARTEEQLEAPGVGEGPIAVLAGPGICALHPDDLQLCTFQSKHGARACACSVTAGTMLNAPYLMDRLACSCCAAIDIP